MKDKLTRREFLASTTGALAAAATPALGQSENAIIINAYRNAISLANNPILFEAVETADTLFPSEGYDSLRAAFIYLRRGDINETIPNRIEAVADVAYCVNIYSANMANMLLPFSRIPENTDIYNETVASGFNNARAIETIINSQGRQVHTSSCRRAFATHLRP